MGRKKSPVRKDVLAMRLPVDYITRITARGQAEGMKKATWVAKQLQWLIDTAAGGEQDCLVLRGVPRFLLNELAEESSRMSLTPADVALKRLLSPQSPDKEQPATTQETAPTLTPAIERPPAVGRDVVASSSLRGEAQTTANREDGAVADGVSPSAGPDRRGAAGGGSDGGGRDVGSSRTPAPLMGSAGIPHDFLSVTYSSLSGRPMVNNQTLVAMSALQMWRDGQPVWANVRPHDDPSVREWVLQIPGEDRAVPLTGGVAVRLPDSLGLSWQEVRFYQGSPHLGYKPLDRAIVLIHPQSGNHLMVGVVALNQFSKWYIDLGSKKPMPLQAGDRLAVAPAK